MTRWARWCIAVAIGVGIVSACQERLTSPGECPELCPGGSPQVFDTVIPAVAGLDSSFPGATDWAAGGGYVNRGRGTALLLSNGFPGSEDRPIYRFAPRSDQIAVRDTFRTFTVDSAQLNLTLVARDTLVGGLTLFLYRIPSGVDSTVSFTGVEPFLVPANLIDSIVVPDSVHTGTVVAKLDPTEVGRVAFAGTDSTLAIALRMTASAPTGVRVGSLASSTSATFTSFVTLDVPDTGSVKHQSVSRPTAFNTFVTENPVVPVDSLLTVGGEPSSRALVRFGLSRSFLDSASIVRATLELTPVAPVYSLRGDPSFMQAVPVVGDVGAKSPISSDSIALRLGTDTLPLVLSDTIRFNVTRHVQVWQASSARPQSIFLRIAPEAATFARAQFFSTRSHAADPSVVVAPRLRITYQRSFRFETP
ncbi:MAG TPA: hypothetical protein VFJ81_15050 [Gemmatimonadales bacterium]|nr:hypothetical protein [Gemmatimonadales bacterium]